MNLRVLITSVIHLLAYISYSIYLDSPIKFPFGVLVFCLTFLAYNFIIYLKLKKVSKANLSFYLINALFILFVLLCLPYLSSLQITLILLSGIITFLYDNSIRLRERYFLKPLTIAVSWSLILIALLETKVTSSLSLSIFLQIFSLSIIYDEKDYEQDKLYRLKTIRGELGFIEMALVSSLIYASSIIVFGANSKSMLIEIVLFAIIMMIIKKTKSSWAFIALLDSLIFIRPIISV